jgi:hypothetical protein
MEPPQIAQDRSPLSGTRTPHCGQGFDHHQSEYIANPAESEPFWFRLRRWEPSALSAISYQLSAISYQLSAIGYQLSAISYQLSAISYQLSAISYQLSAISYQLSE